eukprot:m.83368 g.83368  ORF g.83368 m.83368 type:complete len:640 (-) comp8159_c0_seq1:222-2141(-)
MISTLAALLLALHVVCALERHIPASQRHDDVGHFKMDEGQSFEQWRASLRAETSPIREAPPITEFLINYASTDCGAEVVAANAEAKSASAILNRKSDDYMLTPCHTRLWLVVELCEPILVQQIVLANTELFSSMVDRISVFVADSLPAVWHRLDDLRVQNVRWAQRFNISAPVMFAKYIRLEAEPVRSAEFYCPLNMLQVYGTSMIEEFNFIKRQQGRTAGALAVTASKAMPPQQHPASDGALTALAKLTGLVRDLFSIGTAKSAPAAPPLVTVMNDSDDDDTALATTAHTAPRPPAHATPAPATASTTTPPRILPTTTQPVSMPTSAATSLSVLGAPVPGDPLLTPAAVTVATRTTQTMPIIEPLEPPVHAPVDADTSIGVVLPAPQPVFVAVPPLFPLARCVEHADTCHCPARTALAASWAGLALSCVAKSVGAGVILSPRVGNPWYATHSKKPAKTSSSNDSTAPLATTVPASAPPTGPVAPLPEEPPLPMVVVPVRESTGHQESVFMELLLRIQALEQTANLTQIFLNKLGSSYYRLNASYTNLSSDVAASLSALRNLTDITNSSVAASAQRAPLLRVILESVSRNGEDIARLEHTARAQEARLSALLWGVQLIVGLLGAIFLLLVVLVLRPAAG